jgi:hypothetical protein
MQLSEQLLLQLRKLQEQLIKLRLMIGFTKCVKWHHRKRIRPIHYASKE